MKLNKMKIMLFLVTICLWNTTASAGVIVGGTRVIYDGNKKEVSLSVKNPDKVPYLIQSWTDDYGPNNENKNSAKPPFVVTPPLFRLDPGSENILRIILTDDHLPEDRESVYWMNIKSIPASVKSGNNVLQISVKTRIKIFYRPGNIKAPVFDDYKQVSFRRLGNQIQVTNPTPYYLSLFSMKIGNIPIVTTNVMVPPKGSSNYPMPANASGDKITWQIINDFGGSSKIITSLLQ